jgi:hypothetical protein
VNLAFGSSWCIFHGFDSTQQNQAHLRREDTVKGYLTSGYQEQVGPNEIRPYLSSSKEYTLTAADQDIVSRYRLWLQDYFANEFNYESTLYMSLNKVREFILNEQSQQNCPRKG